MVKLRTSVAIAFFLTTAIAPIALADPYPYNNPNDLNDFGQPIYLNDYPSDFGGDRHQRIAAMLDRLHDRAGDLQDAINNALNRGDRDDSPWGNRLEDFVSKFKDATGHLKDDFGDHHPRQVAADLQQVLDQGHRLGEVIERRRFGPRVQESWVAVRQILDHLQQVRGVGEF